MATNGDDTLEVVPIRHYGRWVGSAVAVVLVAMLVHTLFSKVPTGLTVCAKSQGVRHCHQAQSWRFGWNIVRRYYTSSEVLHGIVLTIELTVFAMIIGITLGVLLAVMRLSKARLISSVAWAYTWFFRGTPVYVQILFWFNVGALYQTFRFGVPFVHVDFFSVNANSLFTPFRGALFALGLNEAAYFSEIARAGLISVDEGQIEAATSLGMTHGQTLRLVMLPQAMRIILPPTGNEVISMLKTSSLASAAGVIELTGAAGNIAASNYDTIQLLITASLWYLFFTTILSIGQFYLERHFAKGALRSPPLTPMQRLRGDVRGILSKVRPHQMVPKEVR